MSFERPLPFPYLPEPVVQAVNMAQFTVSAAPAFADDDSGTVIEKHTPGNLPLDDISVFSKEGRRNFLPL